MMNGRPAVLLAFAAIGVASIFIGCSKSREAVPEPSTLPAETSARIDEAVTAYDVVRGALADDRGDVKTSATELADAARLAAASAPDNVRRPLEELSSAAQRLAGLESADLSEARKAFGDVSQALIAVLSAEPSLQQGRHVYECPMAKGYKKWVQVSEGVSNPYMGTDMLQCGTEADF
ncbi:MAG: hypothetical protein WBN15_04845 [Polyangiales bacterium]|jgi:hypothetical protein